MMAEWGLKEDQLRAHWPVALIPRPTPLSPTSAPPQPHLIPTPLSADGPSLLVPLV